MNLPDYQYDNGFLQQFSNIKKTENYVLLFSKQCPKPQNKLAGLLVNAIDYEYTKMGKPEVISNDFCENFSKQNLWNFLCQFGTKKKNL